ncbi:NAD(P)H-binding protein [Oleiharenicola sp. Vm1]|uniref:NAD(P)H-binding protein n=1 Tax=Oleiharenicola sp. Vm1 TaxID=3398393 RepID=UPI0039F5B14A
MATALIAGASGLVGGCLLQELLAADTYDRVVAVARRPLDVAHPKLVTVTTEFAALRTLERPLRGDDAFCCLGTTIKKAGSREAFRAVDQGAVLAFAWAAQQGGARRFFHVSSMGADASSRFFYTRVKGETDHALGVMGFDTLGIFRPSLLLGPRTEYRLGERLSAVGLALSEPFLIGRWRKFRAIPAEVVARAMLRASFGQGARGTLIYPSDEIQDLGRR